VWPEVIIQDSTHDDASNAAFGSKIVRLFNKKSKTPASSAIEYDDFIDVKALQKDNHKEYRKKTLIFYLYHLNDIVDKNNALNDPVQFVETTHAIFDQVHRCYLYYDNHEKGWKFYETKEVCYLSLYV